MGRRAALMLTLLQMLLLVMTSQQASARLMNCSTQIMLVRAKADKCLQNVNPVHRFMCINPIRNELHTREYIGCEQVTFSFEKEWTKKEQKKYPNETVGIQGAADPLACRNQVPLWTAKLKACVERRSEDARTACLLKEELPVIAHHSDCPPTYNRISQLISNYNSKLHPERLPATASDNLEIKLIPERKSRLLAK